MFAKKFLKPNTNNKYVKIKKEMIPSIPVVEKNVGISPEPDTNEVFQNLVEFITFGLCIDQTSSNLFGPTPMIGLFFNASFVTYVVEDRDGLISRLVNFKRSGIYPPINWPDIKNKRETIIVAKEKAGNSLFLSSPSPLWEEKEILYTKINKAKTPTISQTRGKFTKILITTEKIIKPPKANLIFLGTELNSITKREMMMGVSIWRIWKIREVFSSFWV